MVTTIGYLPILSAAHTERTKKAQKRMAKDLFYANWKRKANARREQDKLVAKVEYDEVPR